MAANTGLNSNSIDNSNTCTLSSVGNSSSASSTFNSSSTFSSNSSGTGASGSTDQSRSENGNPVLGRSWDENSLREELKKDGAVGSPRTARINCAPLRNKRTLNGRLSASTQMLNGDGVSPNGGMGTTRTARASRPKTLGSLSGENLGVSPIQSLLNLHETSASAISEIPSKTEIARWRHRNSVTILSAGNTPHSHLPVQELEENLGTPNDKDAQSGSVPTANRSHKSRFVKVFPEIAEVDAVIKWYHCAYWNDVLFQGILYVTSNWFCFHSKLMGKKRVVIHVGKVLNISKKKTALIIPDAVSVTTDTKKFVFGSLVFRDSTYDLMHEVWKQHQEGNQAVDKRSSDRSRTYSSDDCATLASSSSESYAQSLASPSGLSSELSPLPTPGSVAEAPPVAASRRKRQTNGGPYPQSNENREDVVDGVYSISGSLNTMSVISRNGLITWLRSLSRTNLVLVISTILVLFLMVSAVFLAYKLILLQASIRAAVEGEFQPQTEYFKFSKSSLSHHSPSSSLSGEEAGDTKQFENHVLKDNIISNIASDEDAAVEELLYRRQDLHFSALERINSVLESHISVLDQINEAMKDLSQTSDKSCQQSSNHISQHSESRSEGL